MLKVSKLTIYPIKSCRGVNVDKAKLDRFGFENDRRWMLIDQNNKFVTQRQLPALARIKALTRHDGVQITLGDQSHIVNRNELKDALTVTVWNDNVEALDAGTIVSEWINNKLELNEKRHLRLVYMPDESYREVDNLYAKHKQTVSFADGFPLLLISKASLDLLNSKLSTPVPMNRFRPNIVVEGCDPHAEDKWKAIKVNGVEFEVCKPCSRCVVPSIDQLTGDKNNEILSRLREYRLDLDKQIYFGQNLLYQLSEKKASIIKTGDAVQIIN